MIDLTWLAQEAKTIHTIFNSLFFSLVLTFLLFGVFLEYFKWPLGGTPAFAPLAGRVLVAAIMLYTLPDVMNMIADLTDSLTKQLGDLNKLKLVADKLGDSYNHQSQGWSGVKELAIWLAATIGFFLLHFTIHISDAFLLFTWTLLYIFSPVLIALFVFPQTSGATKALYQSLIEVSCWKIVWSVLATLLWSAALSDLSKPGTDISFISALGYELILAFSLLITPLVVHALAGQGLSSIARSLDPKQMWNTVTNPMKSTLEWGKKGYNLALGSASVVSTPLPPVKRLLNKVPRMNTKKSPPLFRKASGHQTKNRSSRNTQGPNSQKPTFKSGPIERY